MTSGETPSVPAAQRERADQAVAKAQAVNTLNPFADDLSNVSLSCTKAASAAKDPRFAAIKEELQQMVGVCQAVNGSAQKSYAEVAPEPKSRVDIHR